MIPLRTKHTFNPSDLSRLPFHSYHSTGIIPPIKNRGNIHCTICFEYGLLKVYFKTLDDDHSIKVFQTMITNYVPRKDSYWGFYGASGRYTSKQQIENIQAWDSSDKKNNIPDRNKNDVAQRTISKIGEN
jgi:hypothetical protein